MSGSGHHWLKALSASWHSGIVTSPQGRDHRVVPQFWLRPLANEEKRLSRYDITRDRPRAVPVSVKSATVERDFYGGHIDLSFPGGRLATSFGHMDDLVGQPHCPECDIVMRTEPHAFVCPHCGRIELIPHVEMPPEFDGPSVDGF